MSSFLRDSKFRHVQATLAKREYHYESLKTYAFQNDINGVAGNSRFFAHIDSTGTGSALSVIPLTSVGKNHVPISSPAYMPPLIRAHSQKIEDFAFDTFDDHRLYTCSADRTVKLWQVPEDGLLIDINAATMTLGLADGSAARGLATHPTAANILAARSSRSICIFDLAAGKPSTSSAEMECMSSGGSGGGGSSSSSSSSSGGGSGVGSMHYTGDIQSMAWSSNGQLLLTTSKDKQLRLMDPRAGMHACVAAVAGHSGLRFSRTVWLGDGSSSGGGGTVAESPYFLSCGHNNAQEREYMIWDVRKLLNTTSGGNTAAGIGTAALRRARIDSGYGPLVPLYDADTGLIMILGRGDSSLRIYEIDPAVAMNAEIGDENPVTHDISNTSIGGGGGSSGSGGNAVTKGVCMLPKQTNDRMAGEVVRLLRLVEGSVQPVSLHVPRREKLTYPADLFPDTVSGASAADCGAMASAQWLDGALTGLTKIALPPPPAPAASAATGNTVTTGAVTFEDAATNPTSNTISGESVGDAENTTTTTTTTTVVPSRAQVVSAKLSGLSSGCKFRHMYATESPKESTYYNLQPDLSAIESPIVACSDTYWAVPYRGGGGPVYVSPLAAASYGKVEPDCGVLNGHKAPVVSLAFSPFHSSILATASSDAKVQIWDVASVFPSDAADCGDGDKATRTTTSSRSASTGLTSLEPAQTFQQHTNSVRTVDFHPTVSGLAHSTSQDMTVRYFDVEQGSEVSHHTVPSIPINTSYSYDGTLLAVAAKDRTVRIYDPRAAGAEVACSEDGKGAIAMAPAGSRISTNMSLAGAIGRNLRTIWCSTRTGVYADPIVTVSASNNGMRQLHVWDIRNFSTPLLSKPVDNASGQLFPMFDETMNTLFLAGKGDIVIRSYELLFLESLGTEIVTSASTLAATSSSSSSSQVATIGEDGGAKNPDFVEKSGDFQAGAEPIAGVCLLPKRCCDIAGVEVARLLKLTSNSVIPVRFRMPRAAHLSAYFHDDIYPLARVGNTLATVPDWMESMQQHSHNNTTTTTGGATTSSSISGCGSAGNDTIFQPVLQSLCPDGMTPLSQVSEDKLQAPSQTHSKVDGFKQRIQQQEAEAQVREDKFSRLQQLAVQNAQYNKNLSGGGHHEATAAAEDEEVDSDDNWDDD